MQIRKAMQATEQSEDNQSTWNAIVFIFLSLIIQLSSHPSLFQLILHAAYFMMWIIMDRFFLQKFTAYSLPVKYTHRHTHSHCTFTDLKLSKLSALLMFLHPLDVAQHQQQPKAMAHLTEVRQKAGQRQGARKEWDWKGMSQRWQQGEVDGRSQRWKREWTGKRSRKKGQCSKKDQQRWLKGQ